LALDTSPTYAGYSLRAYLSARFLIAWRLYIESWEGALYQPLSLKEWILSCFFVGFLVGSFGGAFCLQWRYPHNLLWGTLTTSSEVPPSPHWRYPRNLRGLCFAASGL